jgi:hypothetical protein
VNGAFNSCYRPTLIWCTTWLATYTTIVTEFLIGSVCKAISIIIYAISTTGWQVAIGTRMRTSNTDHYWHRGIKLSSVIREAFWVGMINQSITIIVYGIIATRIIGPISSRISISTATR